MQFEFATATRILFGEGAVREVAPAAKQLGRRALLVTGRAPERGDRLLADLNAAGVRCSAFSTDGEPTVDLVRRGVENAREEQCEVVIAFGGGSAIDAGKAIAALLTNPGELMDYLEVVGGGKSLQIPAAPLLTVPTTAGTGSEVTRNAVLGVPERRVKVSVRSPLMLPRLAVVDPELTLGLPPAVTARTGLDALTQLIEAYVSIRANPLTDGFCVEGIRCAARSLRRAFHEGHDLEARRDMSLAALLSGLALANAGLGVVHGFAGPLGGRFPAPHGAICAAILPHGMEINLRALHARAPQSQALRRYVEVARILTGRADAPAEEGIAWARETCRELEIPPLSAYGMSEQDVPALITEAAKASSMKGNPLVLRPEELREVLLRSLAGS
ncbi:MAG: iron-containing alcohol dehydrogenase [Acidobacteriia bacterium]|nr:iron-containing alcohol dehydrogenase [Terriglobia bacterium]